MAGAGEILVATGRLEDDQAGCGGEQTAQGFHKFSLYHVLNFSSVTMAFFTSSLD
jgi:hypothetical protein